VDRLGYTAALANVKKTLFVNEFYPLLYYHTIRPLSAAPTQGFISSSCGQ
jgi:hypothetical protein